MKAAIHCFGRLLITVVIIRPLITGSPLYRTQYVTVAVGNMTRNTTEPTAVRDNDSHAVTEEYTVIQDNFTPAHAPVNTVHTAAKDIEDDVTVSSHKWNTERAAYLGMYVSSLPDFVGANETLHESGYPLHEPLDEAVNGCIPGTTDDSTPTDAHTCVPTPNTSILSRIIAQASSMSVLNPSPIGNSSHLMLNDSAIFDDKVSTIDVEVTSDTVARIAYNSTETVLAMDVSPESDGSGSGSVLDDSVGIILWNDTGRAGLAHKATDEVCIFQESIPISPGPLCDDNTSHMSEFTVIPVDDKLKLSIENVSFTPSSESPNLWNTQPGEHQENAEHDTYMVNPSLPVTHEGIPANCSVADNVTHTVGEDVCRVISAAINATVYSSSLLGSVTASLSSLGGLSSTQVGVTDANSTEEIMYYNVDITAGNVHQSEQRWTATEKSIHSSANGQSGSMVTIENESASEYIEDVTEISSENVSNLENTGAATFSTQTIFHSQDNMDVPTIPTAKVVYSESSSVHSRQVSFPEGSIDGAEITTKSMTFSAQCETAVNSLAGNMFITDLMTQRMSLSDFAIDKTSDNLASPGEHGSVSDFTSESSPSSEEAMTTPDPVSEGLQDLKYSYQPTVSGTVSGVKVTPEVPYKMRELGFLIEDSHRQVEETYTSYCNRTTNDLPCTDELADEPQQCCNYWATVVLAQEPGYFPPVSNITHTGGITNVIMDVLWTDLKQFKQALDSLRLVLLESLGDDCSPKAYDRCELDCPENRQAEAEFVCMLQLKVVPSFMGIASKMQRQVAEKPPSQPLPLSVTETTSNNRLRLFSLALMYRTLEQTTLLFELMAR